VADRTSAEIFGNLFTKLAEDHVSLEGEKQTSAAKFSQRQEYITGLAEHLWGMTWGYDFNQYQMDCDDSLIVLGLAEEGDEDEDGYTQTRYRNKDLTGWEPT